MRSSSPPCARSPGAPRLHRRRGAAEGFAAVVRQLLRGHFALLDVEAQRRRGLLCVYFLPRSTGARSAQLRARAPPRRGAPAACSYCSRQRFPRRAGGSLARTEKLAPPWPAARRGPPLCAAARERGARPHRRQRQSHGKRSAAARRPPSVSCISASSGAFSCTLSDRTAANTVPARAVRPHAPSPRLRRRIRREEHRRRVDALNDAHSLARPAPPRAVRWVDAEQRDPRGPARRRSTSRRSARKLAKPSGKRSARFQNIRERKFVQARSSPTAVLARLHARSPSPPPQPVRRARRLPGRALKWRRQRAHEVLDDVVQRGEVARSFARSTIGRTASVATDGATNAAFAHCAPTAPTRQGRRGTASRRCVSRKATRRRSEPRRQQRGAPLHRSPPHARAATAFARRRRR